MPTIPVGNTGPFSTTKVAVIAFVGAKGLLAIHTGPAIAAALVLGVIAKRLPPTARGKIRGTYAAARELVRSRVVATSQAARQIAEHTNARIRTKIVNGVLLITIWAAFAVESRIRLSRRSRSLLRFGARTARPFMRSKPSRKLDHATVALLLIPHCAGPDQPATARLPRVP